MRSLPRTLGVALDWIPQHCVIPDGFRRGAPFVPYDWQTLYLGSFYLVRPDAVWMPDAPLLGPAFVYRRGLKVGPQKVGKDPLDAAHICLEGTGPCLFAGWAEGGEVYACSEHGCRCGWTYIYDPGEPMAMTWPSALVQITAVSEEATQNTYDALRPMIELGPLADLMPRTGEEFIRLPNGGRIDTVTASANSRLGQRVTFVTQGEVGLWDKTNGMAKVADTQYRGLAGMGGRASLSTNAWDPAQQSVGQIQFESAAQDIYRQFIKGPVTLSIRNKEERRKLLRFVYPRDSLREHGGHVDLDAIEAEAADLAARDPAQAGRFFGNQLLTGAGKAFDVDVWADLGTGEKPKKGALIVGGFDGSDVDDQTALILCDVATGFIWAAGIWNPAEHGGKVPRDQVNAAIDDAATDYKLLRLNADPPYWRDEIADWRGRYGEEVIKEWPTYRNRVMGFAVRDFATAVSTGALTHDGDAVFAKHIANAHRKELNERDDKGVRLWTLQKERAGGPDKIDAAVAAVLAWEARLEAIAEGALNRKPLFRAFVA